MKGVVILNLVVSMIEITLYIVNITFVLQNLVFTHNSFTTANVPFYDSSLGEGTTKRYNYHWWEYATDTLRIFPTIFSFIAITLGVHFKIKNVGFYVGLTSILLVLEILKSFKRAIDYVRCGSMNLCRNFDVGENESPSTANAIFVASAFFTVTFAILHAFRIGIFQYIESSIQEYIDVWRELKGRNIEDIQIQRSEEEIRKIQNEIEEEKIRSYKNKSKTVSRASRNGYFSRDEYELLLKEKSQDKKRGRSASRSRK